MKIAIIQMPVVCDKQANIGYARQKIYEAAQMNADMAVLPEMFCCPYSGGYFLNFSEADGGPAQAALSDTAKKTGMIIVGGSVPEADGGKLYNTSYVYDAAGVQIAKHRKAHLFDVDVIGGVRFFESDYFNAGDAVTVFDTSFGTLGLCVCFDFRFPEMARIMALKGAAAIIVPAAFNMTTGPAHWETMFRQRAVDNQIFTIGASPARDADAAYVSYGNSIVADPWGEVIARCGGGACTLITDLDFGLIDKIRDQLPLISARRTDMYEVRAL